ncbi:hypothetical protein DB30_07507 [Enhygromyxa salina]|uniref:Uncharacterized protein n=1 Tax=Enhygromyxa salina TaxID=215803 RepID=A0A0C2D132_9BACT|nr:hypothetical protein [Enhygromyxa salina]KIG13852.1 hypothetical protein DB30_07507 [Enhygromyxa salina]
MPVVPIVLGPMLALALVMSPAPAQPQPSEPGDADGPVDPGEANPQVGDPASEVEAESDAVQPEVTQVERGEAPSGGGVAGAIVDPNDPNATRAQSDLEGESLSDNVAGVPERLPRLQAAGWWTTFGAVALATTGGILAGVAETRQDKAERLAYGFDLSTGRTNLYGPLAGEYEQLLRQGQTYQWLARGFIIGGAATLVAGVAIFAIDASQRRRGGRSTTAGVRLDPSLGGLSLRF